MNTRKDPRPACLLLLAVLSTMYVQPSLANPVVVTYPKASYTVTSSTFSVTANNQAVDVLHFMDYHYAHFSFGGPVTIKITASSTVKNFDISPHSLGIAGSKSGNTLNFTIHPAATTPNYLVIQINSLQKLVILADPLETNVPPSSGPGIFNVGQSPYNADSTGSVDVTAILQQAIDDASAATGGTVYVPPGVYKVVRRLFLRNNVTLYLAGGAVVRSTTSRTEMINADMAFLDGENEWRIRPVVVTTATTSNAKIQGRGVIDASGIALMDTQTLQYRRRALELVLVNNLAIEGITIKDATGWTLRVNRSQDVAIEDVKVLNHKNASLYKIQNDGINLSSSSDAIINGNFVMTVDDALCSKSETVGFDTKRVLFSNNVVFTSCAGVKAGMQARGPMSDIWFHNIDVVQARRGIVVEATTGDVIMSGISFQDIRVEKQVSTSSGSQRNLDLYANTASIRDIWLSSVTFEQNHPRLLRAASGRTINNVVFNGVAFSGTQLTSSSQLTLTGSVSDLFFNAAVSIGMEAEAGTLVAPMVAASDANASGGQFVWVPEGSGSNLVSPGGPGSVTMSYAAPVSGTYALWARVIFPDGSSDSFFVRSDGVLVMDPWNISGTSATWVWKKVVNLDLEVGPHMLEFRQREDGTQLDAVLLTTNLGFTP